MPFRRSLIVALSLSAAACVAPRTPPPPAPVATATPRPAPTPTPSPVYTSWMDVPQTPGDWFYARTSAGSTARFGAAQGEGQFALVCTPRSRTIALVRYGPFAGDAPMTVRSETATRTLSATLAAEEGGLRAVLPASDPLLDAMAFSKGRFAIEAAGAQPLYLPSWPEVTRVIEDCR